MTDHPYPFPTLDAYCPGCGQRTLYRGFRGVVSCRNDECPNPAAAHQLLGDPHLAEHTVMIGQPYIPADHHWTLRHPAMERVGKSAYTCDLSRNLRANALAHPKLPPGLYRVDVHRHSRVWRLTRLTISGEEEKDDGRPLDQGE